jgi:hypothetical protein
MHTIFLQALIMVLTSSILITKLMVVLDREPVNKEKAQVARIEKRNSQIFSKKRTSVKITSTKIQAINLILILVAPNNNNSNNNKNILSSNSKDRM